MSGKLYSQYKGDKDKCQLLIETIEKHANKYPKSFNGIWLQKKDVKAVLNQPDVKPKFTEVEFKKITDQVDNYKNFREGIHLNQITGAVMDIKDVPNEALRISSRNKRHYPDQDYYDSGMEKFVWEDDDDDC